MATMTLPTVTLPMVTLPMVTLPMVSLPMVTLPMMTLTKQSQSLPIPGPPKLISPNAIHEQSNTRAITQAIGEAETADKGAVEDARRV